MGLYTGDLDRIGVLSFDAWRASRLVVDTGMHALGWTRERAIDFMLEHTALAPNNIANEVDRYIVLPGPGARLQDRPAGDPAAPRRGPRAARRRPSTSAPSTTRVLGNGALALPTLRGIVEAWVAEATRPGASLAGVAGRRVPRAILGTDTPRPSRPARTPWPPTARSPTPAPPTPASATATR